MRPKFGPLQKLQALEEKLLREQRPQRRRPEIMNVRVQCVVEEVLKKPKMSPKPGDRVKYILMVSDETKAKVRARLCHVLYETGKNKPKPPILPNSILEIDGAKVQFELNRSIKAKEMVLSCGTHECYSIVHSPDDEALSVEFRAFAQDYLDRPDKYFASQRSTKTRRGRSSSGPKGNTGRKSVAGQ